MASRPAVTLRLSAALRDKVVKSGYGTVAELCEIAFDQLSTDLKLTMDQARELQLQLYPEAASVVAFSANQTWEQERRWTPITTSSTALDSLFGGSKGVPPGKITEICGLAGTGKTLLGLQLCLNAQIPVAMGGAGGTSIFIDSEGSFIAKRVANMANALAERLSREDSTSEPGHDRPTGTADDLMRGIQYCRVHSPVELIAMIRMLHGIVKAHPKIKLVVVDTIAFLFRSNFSDMTMRTKIVATLGRQLAAIAREFDIAVVALNQMTTKIENNPSQKGVRSADSFSDHQVHPALGETWANICTHRIRLYHVNGNRSARIFKSPTIQEQSVSFEIATQGVVDTLISSGVDVDNDDMLFWEPLDMHYDPDSGPDMPSSQDTRAGGKRKERDP